MDTTLPSVLLHAPLARLHRQAGARLGAWFGCELPDSYGNSAREQHFLTSTVGLIDKSYQAYLTLAGPDRNRFLNAIFTNQIKDLHEGSGTKGLLLNPQGKILAELDVFAQAETLFAISYREIKAQLMEWLEKYIIMDDVSVVDETDRYSCLGLDGPLSAEIARSLTGWIAADVPPLTMAEVEMTVADGTALLVRVLARENSVDFLVERASIEPVWRALAAAVASRSGGPAGYAAWNAQTLTQGIPWFGYDFGSKQIPHEAGLQNSHISYTKGCYTGQEIVERVRSRGQVNRTLVSLVITGDEIPVPDTALLLDKKEVGYITRAGQSFEPLEVAGMGYVRREYSATGTRLEWAGGLATVRSGPD